MKIADNLKEEQQKKTIDLLKDKVSRLERAVSLLERENKRRRDEVIQLAQKLINR